MNATIDTTDVPAIGIHDLYMPMRLLIENGRGLALLNGMSEDDVRALESQIWQHFADRPEVRVAVALRFRALLAVFASRRIRQEFLQQGFKLIAKAVEEAARQRLNMRYGFKAQSFVHAFAPARPAVAVHQTAFATITARAA